MEGILFVLFTAIQPECLHRAVAQHVVGIQYINTFVDWMNSFQYHIHDSPVYIFSLDLALNSKQVNSMTLHTSPLGFTQNLTITCSKLNSIFFLTHDYLITPSPSVSPSLTLTSLFKIAYLLSLPHALFLSVIFITV